MGSSRVQVKCPSCSTVFLPSIEETQSRAGASARRKGHTFERKVAKLLQDWWNQNGKFKYEFKRTPMSGGSVLKVGWGMAGDITTTAPDFPYHLELKNAPGSFAGLHQFLSAPKFKFWDWLKQANGDCPPGKRTIIVFNRYDQPTWCASESNDRITEILSNVGINRFILTRPGHNTIYIWKLEDMLVSNPEMWK